MSGLTNVRCDELVRHLPVVLNQLFRVMCTNDELAIDSLVTMADLLIRARNDAGDIVLAQYTTYVFDNVVVRTNATLGGEKSGGEKEAWEVLVATWLSLLRMGIAASGVNNSLEGLASVQKMCGFFLDVCNKKRERTKPNIFDHR